MILSTLKTLFAPKSIRSTPRAPARFRPQFENMEDRTVPAIFMVGSGYATIQAALNAAAAKAGADTVIVPAGTYTEAITINDSANVTLKAVGNVTINAPANMTQLNLSGTDVGAAVIDIFSKNVTVEGFKINGATNTDGDLFAGIRVMKNGSATIKNNTVFGMLNASDPSSNIGIQIGTSRVSTTLGAATAKVINNTVNNYKGAGILVDGNFASAEVKSNVVTGRGAANGGIAQYGIQISRGATARVESNTVSNNTISGGGDPANDNSAGIYFFELNDRKIVAAKNRVSGNDMGIFVESSSGKCHSDIQIVNNDVIGNVGFAGIFVTASKNVDVKNNDVFCNTTWNGIALSESTKIDIKNNDVTNNPHADGIYVYGGGNNFIKNNDSFNNGYNGIFLEDSTNNCLWNNSTWGNHENGIKVLGGSGNDIWLGDSVCNVLDGILLQDTVCNTVVGNALLSNGGYGLRLVNADNTYVAHNLICGNQEGSIFIDANSTGTVTIANRTDAPPTREGVSGSAGTSIAYTTSVADADADVTTIVEDGGEGE
jgi:parallel beta-helix repeat protein